MRNLLRTEGTLFKPSSFCFLAVALTGAGARLGSLQAQSFGFLFRLICFYSSVSKELLLSSLPLPLPLVQSEREASASPCDYNGAAAFRLAVLALAF